jgi:hypothetical protein
MHNHFISTKSRDNVMGGGKEGLPNISLEIYGNSKIELERDSHNASKAKLISKIPVSPETTSTINIRRFRKFAVSLLPRTRTIFDFLRRTQM